MRKETWYIVSVFLIIIIVLGVSYISWRYQFGVYRRPQNHLPPFPGNTTDLNQIVRVENIEIRVNDTSIGCVDPHGGPITLNSRVTLTVTNLGTEPINDFRGIMGTAFGPNHRVIYSFWLEMKGPGEVLLDNIVILEGSTINVKFYDEGSLTLESFDDIPRYAYLRVMIGFRGNHSATITTPLTWIATAVE